MRPGSPQAAKAYDAYINNLADAYWAAPMPVCERCGEEHDDEDNALCIDCQALNDDNDFEFFHGEKHEENQ